MKIGYLGPQGTFSEEAALLYQGKTSSVTLCQYKTITEALEAVNSGEISEAVVPLENSIEGTVNTTLDTLIFDVNLFIKAEIVIPVTEQLMVKPGTRSFVKVLSHPQPIAQCGKFMRTHYPDKALVSVASTAEAAKMVAASQGEIAAIATRRAAELYQLEIIEENIQDDTHNATRFVVVTREKPDGIIKYQEMEKTSIVFATNDKPGELYRILDIITIWDLNMTKIESRPKKNELGKYVFFVDVETKDSEDLENALKMMERKTSFFKFLGSYPVFGESKRAIL